MITAYKTELSEAEKEKIINEFLPMIKYTAYRLTWRLPPQLTVDDLISAGVIGLLDALQRYEEGRVKLNTFAEFRIKGAMLDELRAQEWMPKSLKKKVDTVKKAHLQMEKELGRLPEDKEVADLLGISLDEYYKILQNASSTVALRFEDFGNNDGEHNLDVTECISDPEARSPLDIFEDKSKKEMLAKIISELPEKEKLVLSLYYWEEMTMKEIGKVMDLTESRVCQLHSQSLIRLKAKMHNNRGG
jgi:RNA polymerase sigma factor for flagellar operon FliA